MEKKFQTLAGYCLLLGSLLMVMTMLLHPSGGNIEHIIKIYKIAIISHSLAILSVPFIAFGFYGLAKTVRTENRLSYLGLSFIGFALVAVMLAALLNGLVLPMYVLNHSSETGQNLDSVKLIIRYGVTINAALDYVFIAGYSLAMLTWSVIMIQKAVMPKWLGYLGIILVIVSIIGAALRLNFISVKGFTIYILGIVSWIVLAGYFLINLKSGTAARQQHS